jgi:L-aminopeptidase/D-esterase-like protein
VPHLASRAIARGLAATWIGLAATMTASQMPLPPVGSITEIAGITVGHHTLTERPTGCTVILAPPDTVGGVDVRGGAPGTRETDLLSPKNTVQEVHAIVLSGGSAFGLDAAGGVMRFLAEKGIGYRTSAGPVPIVPAAIIFDLGVGGRPEIRPDADCGYNAAKSAGTSPMEGSVGAGAGATIGKSMGAGRAMKGGLGSASLRTADGLIVAALVVVNASGSIVNPRTGQPVAGVRTADGRSLENPFAIVRRGVVAEGPGRESTTIGVVVTNARLSKAQAMKVAEMAQDGIARTIVPSHTPSDGDTLFALATGALTRDANVSQIGALAAEATADAVIRAVSLARGVPGYPAASEIK